MRVCCCYGCCSDCQAGCKARDKKQAVGQQRGCCCSCWAEGKEGKTAGAYPAGMTVSGKLFTCTSCQLPVLLLLPGVASPAAEQTHLKPIEMSSQPVVGCTANSDGCSSKLRPEVIYLKTLGGPWQLPVDTQQIKLTRAVSFRCPAPLSRSKTCQDLNLAAKTGHKTQTPASAQHNRTQLLTVDKHTLKPSPTRMAAPFTPSSVNCSSSSC